MAEITPLDPRRTDAAIIDRPTSIDAFTRGLLDKRKRAVDAAAERAITETADVPVV